MSRVNRCIRAPRMPHFGAMGHGARSGEHPSRGPSLATGVSGGDQRVRVGPPWHAPPGGRIMQTRMTIAGLAGLLAFAVLGGSCRDSLSPARGPHVVAALASAGTGITLDQVNGTMGQGDITPYGNGSHIGKGFDPRNPHVGDAVVATCFWRGSTNTITTVTDHFSDAAATPIGNTYTLVDYVTSGGMSMATYVATNVQGFVDRDSASDRILTVHALFSEPVTDGGIVISSWTGVGPVTAQALGAHSSAFGSDSTVAAVDPGPIPIGAGALAFGVTMTNGMVGYTVPQGFADLG